VRLQAVNWCHLVLHLIPVFSIMQIQLGLEAHGQSTLMMLPTMIDILPTGCADAAGKLGTLAASTRVP